MALRFARVLANNSRHAAFSSKLIRSDDAEIADVDTVSASHTLARKLSSSRKHTCKLRACKCRSLQAAHITSRIWLPATCCSADAYSHHQPLHVRGATHLQAMAKLNKVVAQEGIFSRVRVSG